MRVEGLLAVVALSGVLGCGGLVERDHPGTFGGSGASGGGSSAGGTFPDGDPTGSVACSEQRRVYGEYRAQVLWEFADTPCTTDADCGTYDDQTGCSPTCTYAIQNRTRRAIDDRLYAFAEQNCLPVCPAQPLPPCPARAEARCVADLRAKRSRAWTRSMVATVESGNSTSMSSGKTQLLSATSRIIPAACAPSAV